MAKMHMVLFRIAAHPSVLYTAPSSIIASSGTIADVDTVAVEPIQTRSPTCVRERITEFVYIRQLFPTDES